MADTAISPQARATRRRALGRKIDGHQQDLVKLQASLQISPDRIHLTEAEGQHLDKILGAITIISQKLSKLAQRLESG